MKKNLKAFFIFSIFCLFLLLNYIDTVEADYQGITGSYSRGTKCIESGDSAYAVVCGRVTQTGATEYKEEDTIMGQQAAPGVTVRIHNCNNEDPTCKDNGNVIRPFNATVTDTNGEFRLILSKLDDLVTRTVNGVEIKIPRQSKRRYLSFWCGDDYQYTRRIPSYLDVGDLTFEVDCPNYTPKYIGDTYSDFYLGKPIEFFKGDPLEEYKLANREEKLAVHVGIDPELYPEYAGLYDSNDTSYFLATQMYLEDNSPIVQTTKDLYLEGADPRFNYPPGKTDGDKLKLTQTYLGNNFTQDGSWFSLDCPLKTTDAKWSVLCPTDINTINSVSYHTSWDPKEYENKLYTSGSFNVQHVLPGIPPVSELLFYREFTPRQDINRISASPVIFSRFLQTAFSNIKGNVFIRIDMEEKKEDYVNCEMLRMGVDNISDEKDIVLNSYISGGYARGMANPAEYNTALEDMDPKTPICRRAEDSAVILYEQIQPPNIVDPSGYELDKNYWSPELILYLGVKNSRAGYWSFKSDNPENSYAGVDTNGEPIYLGGEAVGYPHGGGISSTFQTNGPYPQNSPMGTAHLTSGDSEILGPLARLISNPIRAYEGDSEKWMKLRKVTETEVLAGNPISLGFYEDIAHLGEYSKVNEEAATIVNTPEKDSNIYDNYYNKGNIDHHFDSILEGLTKSPGREPGEKRTQLSGIYFTTAAYNRVLELRNRDNFSNFLVKARYDALDSILSTIYGMGIVDWDRGNTIYGGFLNTIIQVLRSMLNENKSFLDRKHSDVLANPDLIDSLVTEPFPVNEANFRTLFPLPCVSSGLNKEDWGADQICYPWNIIEFNPEDPQRCGTYDKEKKCNINETETADNQGVSRTCRVNECYHARSAVDCECNRSIETTILPSGSVLVEWGYDSPNCTPTEDIKKGDGVSIIIPATPEPCDDTPNDLSRLICAQKQYTCYESGAKRDDLKECLSIAYFGDLNNAARSIESYGPEYCENKKWPNDGLEIDDTDEKTLKFSVPIDTPMCAMDIAGPHECDGNLQRNSPIKADQQTIYEDALPKSDMNQSVISDIEMANLWANPAQTRITSLSGMLMRFDSSIRADDLISEMDTYGPTGDNTATTRRMLTPQLLYPVEHNPTLFYCTNDSLGGNGSWECPTLPEPNPVFIDLDKLVIDPSCAVNIDNPNCREEILGSSDLQFSDTFQKVMNAAATRFQIPASVLLAYMGAINGPGPGTKFGTFFAEENNEILYKASSPWYGVMGNCDDMQDIAVGPWDWIFIWFGGALQAEPDTAAAALEELSIGRSMTASRCNFLDSTYVLARNLRGAIPPKDSCSAWTFEDALNELKIMTFGVDPKGSYEEKLNNLYGDGGRAKRIFENCR